MTEPGTFSERLLAWWSAHGRHDLPWQHPRTPYRVWVSEIMLQQTQVATVMPYFERWMDRLPDLKSLASADIDQVLALWSGLGYYARARNLHKAAIACLERHGGKLPDSPELLAALPGIGQSTANAIISQAHDRPLAILDGNARRVLARHAAVAGWAGKSSVAKVLWREAGKRLPPERGADYTQAIMDLGASLCSRNQPGCRKCPVAADCSARLQGAVDRYPASKPRTAVREVAMHMLVLQRGDGAVLLERRPPAGIWGGLWCLPDSASCEELAKRFGLERAKLMPLPSMEHRLTHRKLTIHPAGYDSARTFRVAESEQRWCTRTEWAVLGIPRPVLKLLETLVPSQGCSGEDSGSVSGSRTSNSPSSTLP